MKLIFIEQDAIRVLILLPTNVILNMVPRGENDTTIWLTEISIFWAMQNHFYALI